MRPLYLRTQLELLTEIEATVKDGSNALWADADIYRALNVSVANLGNRVMLPRLYTLTSGFTSGQYEYTLPSYIGDNFNVMVAIYSFEYPDDEVQWIPLSGWSVEPTSTGSKILRIYLPYDNWGRISGARLIWYAPNGTIPITIPTLAGTLAADGTSLTTSAAVENVPDVGWVKIDGEWMSYSGISRGASSTTLNNLVRGLFSTTAASHSSTPSIYWGIGVDDTRLWEPILDGAISRLHYIMIHRGTQDDRLNHEKIMGYAADRVDKFWKRSGYVPLKGPRIKLSYGGLL